MAKKDKQKLYRCAWDKWGQESQLRILIEESAELIQAITKYERNKNDDTFDHICEEIADVELSVEQVKQMMLLTKKVDVWKKSKLIRFEILIKKSEIMTKTCRQQIEQETAQKIFEEIEENLLFTDYEIKSMCLQRSGNKGNMTEKDLTD